MQPPRLVQAASPSRQAMIAYARLLGFPLDRVPTSPTRRLARGRFGARARTQIRAQSGCTDRRGHTPWLTNGLRYFRIEREAGYWRTATRLDHWTAIGGYTSRSLFACLAWTISVWWGYRPSSIPVEKLIRTLIPRSTDG